MDRFNGKITTIAPGREDAFLPNLYETSHAANLLELDNGDLLCVWFSGSGEGNPDTNIVLSKLPLGGSEWSRPDELSSDLERSEQNPVLFQAPNGQVWLMHTSNEPHNQQTSRVVRRISEDRGNTWSEPEIWFDEQGIFLRHPIVITSSGVWVLPIYYCKDDGEYSAVKVSIDEGSSWSDHTVPSSEKGVQMNIIERRDSSLFTMFRSRLADRIYTSVSKNDGRTWTEPQPSELPNNNSSTQVVKLANGHLALIYNDASLERGQYRMVVKDGQERRKAVRTPLTLSISEDEGVTWPYSVNLQEADDEYKENEIGYSYPSIIQSRDGKLHIAYTYLRKGLRYVRVNEDWVREHS
ncbi:sialidase family protein [Paenibacillus radicis (ex Xue et al. 2023)]|uniref:Exo-alpha-sialidase n=1 Tax=Paenibacillus radicis (ex Xue et al. 2023) TaxID=2972489 RepID=A0ABT1YBQ3_9BACL|nr:sialidase family protein [Paenibacillus radicis (ex Xue et al. 2023)]MCR8630625.1 exo-alpha-sialidase [Paenibacillus radicis (ex Xue et al. 2023)]